MPVREAISRRGPLLSSVAAILGAQVLLGASGTALFATADNDALKPVDAIVVLGGEHDGRDAYGLELAESGVAPVVVLSNPYEDDDWVMRKMCRDTSDIQVICEAPEMTCAQVRI